MPAIKWEGYKRGGQENSEDYVRSLAPVRRENTWNREREVLEILRLDKLNPEETPVIERTCKDYHDIFHLPGDKLSCTTEVKHSIHLIPGTSPIHTRPYRLPESQRGEIDKQVDKLLKEEIIRESNSPWNSPVSRTEKRR
jgi:hypothetical protein